MMILKNRVRFPPAPMRHLTFLLFTLTLIVSCGIPYKQPQLTDDEKIIEEYLSIECNCKITREFDGEYIMKKSDSTVYYWVLEVDEKTFWDTASLRVDAQKYSQFIKNHIPDRLKVFEIVIYFLNHPTNAGQHGRSYNFAVK